MRDRVDEFKRHGAQLIAIDPHESFRVRHMLRDVGYEADVLTYPILADPANTVSATYGVAFQIGIHTEWSNRPGTFIIDRDGVLRYERRGLTYGDRPTPDQIFEELDKLRHSNKTSPERKRGVIGRQALPDTARLVQRFFFEFLNQP